MSLYSDDALKLVREAKRTADSPFIPPFNEGLVRSCAQETWFITDNIKQIMGQARAAAERVQSRKAAHDSSNSTDNDNDTQEEEETQPEEESEFDQLQRKDTALVEGSQVSATVHRMALDRTKRCLLAYGRHRVDRIVDMLWDIGGGSISSTASLPERTRRNLSGPELEFVDEYTQLVSEYRGRFLDVDVGASLVPAKDLFVDVRVLRDCGEVVTESGTVKLSKNSQHYLRRSDVERFITQGYLQQI